MTPSLEGLPTNAKEAPSGPAGHQLSISMSQGKSGPDFTALVPWNYQTYLNKVRLSKANKNSQLKKKSSQHFLNMLTS